jgi:AcrR family transcriptional regulator
MARPVRANAQATRQKILMTACERFSKAGAGRTSIRDIAGGSGVTLATVHHYFGSKEDLYQACIDAMYSELEQLKGELQTAVSEGGATEAILEQTVRTMFRFGRSHQVALRLLLRDVLDTGAMRRDRRERHQLPLLADGEKLLSVVMPAESPREIRLVIQSINHLIVRYSLTAVVELALICGMRVDEDALDEAALAELEDAATGAVEDHLVAVTQAIVRSNAGPGPANNNVKDHSRERTQ